MPRRLAPSYFDLTAAVTCEWATSTAARLFAREPSLRHACPMLNERTLYEWVTAHGGNTFSRMLPDHLPSACAMRRARRPDAPVPKLCVPHERHAARAARARAVLTKS